MKKVVSKKLIAYMVLTFAILAISGAILFTVTDNYYVLLSVLVIDLIIFYLILVHFFEKYIKPIEKATQTMDKLLQGNYYARVHHEMNGTIGELSIKINELARNLSELTIQEQIQSEQLSTVIDNSESGLVLIDEKGYIHIVNRKFISMFGKKPHDYIGYLYYDVLKNEQFHHTVQQAFLYEKRVRQLFSITKNDEKRYLEIVGAPIFNERNMLRGAVLVIYDITEFKNIEVMRKDFVANVSHELKTPITSIKGFTETLMDGAAEDPKARGQFLHIIYQESKRIQTLIEDLLILSKLEKDESELTLKHIHMDQLIGDLLPIATPSAEEKDIQIDLDIEKSIEMTADEEKIRQIVLNLMMNAINYTPAGGSITLQVQSSDDNVILRVRDSGIGIAKKDLPRIFERFYRVDKARSRETGGTGLGLAIVKHIIELHKGKIEVDSEVNEGTTFTITLPMEQED